MRTDGVVRGLIGPREAPRIWDRHLLNSVLMAPALPRGARVADIGSGAGLPGLVLAIARPDLHVTLVEPLLRRTTFLEEVVAELGLDNVVVARGRAEMFHGKQSFDVVTARAVSAMERLVPWCMPLVAAGGSLTVMKGSSAEDELADAGDVLSAWGCAPAEIVEYDDPDAGSVRLVRVTWAGEPRVSLRTSSARGSSTGARPSSKRSKKQRRRT
ncbi:16S rRNA (guanine(527)-N(7))-methyltransferase RsmG [Nocardioides sambongensis]|uniref:16S rRNA (guanine(527)-N(7))-methyltransferase RsmG n=1 Tax=Nocardioides sambongensis TaxID=2589074 RepID=UPI001E51A3D0|nr:16S rRNA (guanine(527)-N(7))-methyltransferase RsmG [Nocardioides sambongensis]